MSQEQKREPSLPVSAPAPQTAPVKAPAKGLKKGPGPKNGFKAAGPKVVAPAPNSAIDNSPKDFAALKNQFKNPGQATVPSRPLPKRDLGIGAGTLEAKKAQIQQEEAARANEFTAGQLQKNSAVKSELAHVSVKSLRDQINDAFTKRAKMSETEFKASKRQNLDIFRRQMVELKLVESAVSNVSVVPHVAQVVEQTIPEAVLDQIFDLELRLNPNRAEATSIPAEINHQRVIELAARDLIQRIGNEDEIPSLLEDETWTEFTLLATTLEWLVVRLHPEEANQLLESNLTEESVRMVVSMAKDCKHVNHVVNAVKDSQRLASVSSSSSVAAKPTLVRQDSREFARRQREDALLAATISEAPVVELVPMPPHPTQGLNSSLVSKSTRITFSSEAVSSSSCQLNSSSEHTGLSVRASFPSLFAARPAPESLPASVRVVEVVVEKHDFYQYSIEGLLNYIMYHYNDNKNRSEAEHAFHVLQQRFTGYNREEHILAAFKLIKHESSKNPRRVWLEMICPEIKYFGNLQAATRDIFNNKWHSLGTGILMSKTPDTINKCRAEICKNTNIVLFDGLKENKSLPNYEASFIEFSSKFSCYTATNLMKALSDIVSTKYDSKYDALQTLLPRNPDLAPKDLETCVRRVDAILKPEKEGYLFNW